jgi:hypothetical protein
MLRRRRTLAHLVVLLVLPLLHACSSMGRGRSEEAVINVENTLYTRSSVTVYIYSDVGQRYLVGSVPPGTSRSLRFRAADIVGRYQLRAHIDRGAEMVSPPFALNGGETLFWDLRQNTITFPRP